MALHSAEVAGSNHVIHNFVYANAAARTAAVLAATDIGKVARQTDNNTFWILLNDVGPVWSEVTYESAFPDNVFAVQDDGDATKQLNVQLAGATAATTSTIVASQTANRSITLPDATTTLMGTDVAQTFTVKTMDDALTCQEIANPAAPAAGYRKIFAKATGFFEIDSSSTVSPLGGGGGNTHAYSTQNANYTLGAGDDFIFADASGGAFNLTLPAAAGVGGVLYNIKKIDNSANAVTVDLAGGGDDIDGATTYVLSAQYETLTVISDGVLSYLIF